MLLRPQLPTVPRSTPAGDIRWLRAELANRRSSSLLAGWSASEVATPCFKLWESPRENRQADIDRQIRRSKTDRQTHDREDRRTGRQTDRHTDVQYDHKALRNETAHGQCTSPGGVDVPDFLCPAVGFRPFHSQEYKNKMVTQFCLPE